MVNKNVSKFSEWHYNNLYANYKIGEGTTIGSFCDIAGTIGKDCIIQSFAFIPEGVTIENDVFIGPSVTFLNDKYPPSRREEWEEVLVKAGAVIGGSAVILPGVTLGEGCFVGAGSVVTKSIPDGERWMGNPAKKIKDDK